LARPKGYLAERPLTVSLACIQQTLISPRLISSNASILCGVIDTNVIEVWQSEPLRRIDRIQASQPVLNLAISDDKNLLARSYPGHSTDIWHLRQAKIIRSFPPSAEGPIASASSAPALGFWARDTLLVRLYSVYDVPGFLQILHLDSERKPSSAQLTKPCSPNTPSIPLARSWPRRLSMASPSFWDVSSGRELATFTGQLVAFVSFAFTSDGSRLAAGAGTAPSQFGMSKTASKSPIGPHTLRNACASTFSLTIAASSASPK
jgi:hypothetical protein